VEPNQPMKIIQLKGDYEYQGKGKGYERTYTFYTDDGNPVTRCDVYGQCISAPTEFGLDENGLFRFIMRAKGKFLNATYFLEDEYGNRFGSITRKGIGFRWKMLDEDSREVARIIDPANWKEAVFRDLLAAQPDSYAVASDQQLIASIAKEQLLESIARKPKNVIGKVFEKILPERGLTMRIQPGQESNIDNRILIAGMTLLQVHDIAGANRN